MPDEPGPDTDPVTPPKPEPAAAAPAAPASVKFELAGDHQRCETWAGDHAVVVDAGGYTTSDRAEIEALRALVVSGGLTER